MMIPGSKVYEAFKNHLNVDCAFKSMDIYTAWAIWKAAYKSGQRDADQAGAIDMLRRIERWLDGDGTQFPGSMRKEVREFLHDLDASAKAPP